MKRYLRLIALIITSVCASAGQASANSYDPSALAVVARDQFDRINPSFRGLVCFSLPNYKNPKESTLNKINGKTLHLQPGTKCWKPPKGFLLLVNDYQALDSRSLVIKIEIDDMNLKGAHVVTRLREDTYKLKLEGQSWKIESHESKAF